MSYLVSIILFGIPTIVLYAATHWVIPYLTREFEIRSILAWFLSGEILVFFPLFIAAFIGCRMEDSELTFPQIKERLRLNPMTRRDWYWAAGTLLFVGAGSGVLMLGSRWLSTVVTWIQPLNPSPPFMQFHGLEPGESWILLVWLPFFFFNIVGEELWWRGYILPRQEERMKKYTWLVQGVLWTLFHICFGLHLMIMLLPLLFALPYAVQKRKNTWIGIFVHGVFNGMGFLAVAFKLL